MVSKNSQKSGRTKGKRRGPGRRWRKGQSGNPKGRPPLPPDVKAAYRAMHPRALEKINELIDHRDGRVALKASELVCERVEGKVAQGVEHNVSGALTINVIDPYSQPSSHPDGGSTPGVGGEVRSLTQQGQGEAPPAPGQSKGEP